MIRFMEHWRFDPETHRPGEGDVWDHARREYLSGVTAMTLCQKYGMSLRSFRMRARVEKWRRIDRDDCDIPPERGEYHRDDDVSFADLADQTFLNIRRAIGSGRAAEAASWMRLFDKLADRARNEVMADLPDFPMPDPEPDSVHERLLLTAIDAVETSIDSSSLQDDPESGSEALHLLHPVFSECETPAEPEADPVSGSPEDLAFSASDSLEEIQRKALRLLDRRWQEAGISPVDLDQHLKRLGLGPDTSTQTAHPREGGNPAGPGVASG
jgi:hypothetical protein